MPPEFEERLDVLIHADGWNDGPDDSVYCHLTHLICDGHCSSLCRLGSTANSYSFPARPLRIWQKCGNNKQLVWLSEELQGLWSCPEQEVSKSTNNRP